MIPGDPRICGHERLWLSPCFLYIFVSGLISGTDEVSDGVGGRAADIAFHKKHNKGREIA